MRFDRINFINRKNISPKKKFLFFGAGILLLAIIIFSLVRGCSRSASNPTIDVDDNPIHFLDKNQNKSVFNIRELNIRELKNRVVLLNVYNIRDFSYIFSVNLADELERLYKNKVVIIDVITDEIPFDDNLIVNYIIKNDIERPVVNIYNFNLGRGTPADSKYMVLVDDRGTVVDVFKNGNMDKTTVGEALDRLLADSKTNSSRLSGVELEKNNVPQSFIRSLNHIKYLNKIDGTSDGPYFVIVDFQR